MENGSLGVRSCPSQQVARHALALVWRTNRQFIEGIVRGIGNQTGRPHSPQRPVAAAWSYVRVEAEQRRREALGTLTVLDQVGPEGGG